MVGLFKTESNIMYESLNYLIGTVFKHVDK